MEPVFRFSLTRDDICQALNISNATYDEHETSILDALDEGFGNMWGDILDGATFDIIMPRIGEEEDDEELDS